jgi:histidine triad (HIT) family protein
MSDPGYDNSNIFARILREEIPAHKVYEDEHAIAFMDVMPQGKGHTLVVPRAPSRNILDIGAHELQHLAITVQRVARAVVKAFDAQGVTVMSFAEPAGGQSVFHTHFHVIPRFEGTPLKPHSGGMADPEVLAEQAFAIRAVLGGAA